MLEQHVTCCFILKATKGNGVGIIYSIGELSKKTGVTKRTLDYYDEIGLLKPSARSEGGHRLYRDDDIMQLQRILALKNMGFSLDEIKEILEVTKITTWQESLKQQLDMVRKEQQRLKMIEQALIGVYYSIEIEGTVDWQMIFDIIKLYENPEAALSTYENKLDTDQIQKLIELNQQLSDEDIRNWIGIIEKIKKNLHLDPASQEARALVEEWLSQVETLFGGDEELLESLGESLKEQLDDGVVFYPMTKEVVEFIEKVIANHSSGERVGD